MRSPLGRATVLVALGALTSPAAAQTTIIRSTTIGPVFRGDNTPTIMQQQCDYELKDRYRTITANSVVQRVVPINAKLTIVVTDTVTAYDLDSVAPIQRVPVTFTGRRRAVDTSTFKPLRGEFYVETGTPTVLRVRAADSETVLLADPIPDATAKRCNLTFSVRNNFDLGFHSWASGWSAITVPIRWRPAFKKTVANDTVYVPSEIVNSPTLGFAYNWTRYTSRYTYAAGTTNAIRSTARYTGGLGVGFSSGSADKSTSRTAKTPIPDGTKAAFVSVLPTAHLTFGYLGLDFGVAAGTELVLGSKQARLWDRNRRPWYGINVGYAFFKHLN